MEDLVEFKLVGMTFRPEYPSNLYKLQAVMEQAKVRDLGWVVDESATAIPEGPLPLALYRDVENKYDANALEVHAPLLGKGSFIGFVPKELAAEISPLIDAGEEWFATLETVLADPEHEENPGALVLLARQ